jgi:peptidoglycan hydrolase-like protein with peptidoglycan-binding domain
MKNSARQLEEPSGLGELLREGFALTGAAIMRNPAAVGGTTAFLVAMAFVSANALWYQPYRHDGAFFRTRVVVERPQPANRQPAPAPARFEARPAASTPAVAEETTAALPKGDPQVQRVQEILRSLELYTGEVDGLAGPQTASAVEHYRRLVGLEPNGSIDEALLRQLGVSGAEPSAADPKTAPAPETAMSVPIPSDPPLPQPRPEANAGVMQASLATTPDPNIVRIQAGLKAFGNDGIELDGIVGARTRDAIREFQSLFGLPVTGEPDAAVYAKMREIGLTD